RDPQPLESGGEVGEIELQVTHHQPSRPRIPPRRKQGEGEARQPDRQAAAPPGGAEGRAEQRSHDPRGRENGEEELAVPERPEEPEPGGGGGIAAAAEAAREHRHREDQENRRESDRPPSPRENGREQRAEHEPAGAVPEEEEDRKSVV